MLERLRDKERADIYTQMLEKCESDIARLSKRIDEIEHIDETINKRKAEIKSSIEVLDKIIEEESISDSDLRMLIDNIKVFEKDGKLDISITLNGKFKSHIDFYENGETVQLIAL